MMTIYSTGDLIADRYEVMKTLAGGMGVVHLCLDRQEDRPVALKTFKPEYLPDRAARDRFLREGTTWFGLGYHPHVVRAHRVERVGDGREVYLVLEWILEAEGKRDASLRAWLGPGQSVSVEQALLFTLHIVRGMKYASGQIPGLVHRDLKPENILIGRDEMAKVTDFGLAKALMGFDDVGTGMAELQTGAGIEPAPAVLNRTQLTRHGGPGTPLYMAPEQWLADQILDARTDIYALGCMLFEMVAGRYAFAGRNLTELKLAHQHGRGGELPAALPTPVKELIRHCLAVRREDRYPDWERVEIAVTEAYQEVTGQNAPVELTSTHKTRAERVAIGWSYSALGRSYVDIGKAEVALKYFEQARQIALSESERFLEADGLNNLGGAYEALGNVRQAIQFYEQALAILHELGGRRGEGLILSNLGHAYRHLGASQKAIELFERQLAVMRDLGERYGQSAALSGLGVTYVEMGDIHQAIKLHKQALAIDREIGHRVGECSVLNNLGEAYSALGDIQQAITYLEQALAIAQEIGNRSTELNTLGALGNAYFRLKNARRAIEYLEQALVIAHEIGDRRGEGVTLGNLGNVFISLGDEPKAIAYYEQAIAILEELGNIAAAANIHFNLTVAFIRQQRFTKALLHAEQAAQGFAQLGYLENARQAQEYASNLRAVLE